MRDACAHKFAPLSQGRVDPVTKCLECPYHGWQFGESGACTAIPQLEAGQATPRAAAVPSFDTRLTGDVLWAFFDEAQVDKGVVGEELLPFDAFPETRFPSLQTAASTYVRELPYSFDFLVENFMVSPVFIASAHCLTLCDPLYHVNTPEPVCLLTPTGPRPHPVCAPQPPERARRRDERDLRRA